MGKEFVKGEIKIREGRLFLSWRGLGEVFVDYNHIHSTFPLSKDRLESLEREIEKDPVLGKYRKRRKTAVFNVLQIEAPPDVRMPREFYRRINPENAVGHYVQQARWKTGPPGSVDIIEEEIIGYIERKNKIEEKIKNLRREIEKEFCEWPKQRITRYFNSITACLEGKCGEGRAESIAREIEEFNRNSKGKIEYTRKGGLRFYLPSMEGIRFSRHLTAEELKTAKWVFIDIEVPRFRKTEEISWVTMLFYQNGRTKKEMHTLRETGRKEINGYRIVQHGSEEELIEGVAGAINREDPFIVAPYNAPFDLIALRERGNFRIGARNTEPKKDTHIRLMERINVYSRQVYDIMKAEQTAFRFLPNQKLVSAAKQRLEEDAFGKDLDYDQLEDLETIAITGSAEGAREKSLEVLARLAGTEKGGLEEADMGKAAARVIALYASKDVDILPKMVFSPSGSCMLEDYAFICRLFNIELTRAVHSPNAVNDALERRYFEQTGTYMDVVYPVTKRRAEEERKAKETFRKFLENYFGENRPGIYKNVWKVFVPVGDYLRKVVCRYVPEAREFFAYKYRFLDSPERQFFLSQFADSLCAPMLKEYGKYLLETESLEQEFGEFEREMFEPAYRILLRRVCKNSKSGRHFKPLRPETVERYMNEDVRKALGCMEEERFSYLACIKSRAEGKLKRIRRKLGGLFRTSPEEIGKLLDEKLGKAKRFLEESGYDIVALQGNYLYVSGPERPDRKSPVIAVDLIPLLFVADRPYYKKHGFYSGIKITGNPHYLNLFEQEAFADFLDNVFAENYKGAVSCMRERLEMLRNGNVEKERLVFWNESKGLYSGYDACQEGRRVWFPKEDIEKFEPHFPSYHKRLYFRMRRLAEPLREKVLTTRNI